MKLSNKFVKKLHFFTLDLTFSSVRPYVRLSVRRSVRQSVGSIAFESVKKKKMDEKGRDTHSYFEKVGHVGIGTYRDRDV